MAPSTSLSLASTTMPLRVSASFNGMRPSSPPARKFVVKASFREKAVAATALTATMAALAPQVAQAADSGFTPSLNNFLLSIGAGGVVLVAIIGAVVAVSNFDPVNRA